jgi:hypothetical protein
LALSLGPRARRLPSKRLPGQNLVEFGLTIAAVAVIAMVGFKALGAAQATYWGAIQASPILAAPTPAPGDFLHQTLMTFDQSACNQGTSYRVGDSITCKVTVADNNGSNFHTPTGRVDWSLDGNPLASCDLTPSPTDVSSASCGIPSYTWKASDAAMPNPHQLLATYVPSSNHFTNTASLAFTVFPNYQFDPSATSCNYNVAAGAQTLCQVVVKDSLGQPISGLRVAWNVSSLSDPGRGAGLATLSCTTGPASNAGWQSIPSLLTGTLFDSSNANPDPSSACYPAASSSPSVPARLECITGQWGTAHGSSTLNAIPGACRVVYRRLPTATSQFSPGYEDLTVSLPDFPTATNIVVGTPANPHSISVGPNTPDGNDAGGWMTCTGSSVGPASVFSNVFATYQVTNSILTQGNTTTVSCTPVIIDMRASTASVCRGSAGPYCGTDPDEHHPYPPLGSVSFQLDGASQSWQVGGVTVTSCTLVPISFFPPQAPNGTPYASGCAAATLTLNSPGPGHHQLTLVYTGTTHIISQTVPVGVDFTP